MQRAMRLISVGIVLLGLLLPLAACAPILTLSRNVLMRGGALRASDGTARWQSDLGADQPLIADGVAYPLLASPADIPIRDTVAAVRINDGATLWRYHTPAPARVGGITLAGDRIIALLFEQPNSAMPIALRASDGTVLWHGAPIDAAVWYVHSQALFFTYPTIVNGLIVAQINSPRQSPNRQTFNLAAWHLNDGTLAWQQPPFDSQAADGYFASLVPAGSVLIAHYGPFGGGDPLTALDPRTGRTLWQVSAANVDAVTPQFIITSDPSNQEITGLQTSDGSPAWRQILNASMHAYLGAIAVTGSTVYYRQFEDCNNTLCHPHYYALDIADGHIRWDRKLTSAGDIYANFVVFYGDGALYQYFNDTSGHHTTLEAFSANDGSTIWTHQFEEGSRIPFGTPLVAYGAIWEVGDSAAGPCNTFIEALSTRDGSRLWRRQYAPCPLQPRDPHWIDVA